jgi:alpha-glucosidase
MDSAVRNNNSGWWDGSVGYEIYVRSFYDSNGDGIGDLPGITGKLDYFSWLGIDLIWITPFYPSPMADFGYDVSDYCGVDPMFGTLEDFDNLLQEAHKRKLRVIIDLVPNHSSSQHSWFLSSRSSLENDFRDYYHWRDPGPDGGPPNNWVSHFGGSAWTFDKLTEQYYLHLFLPEQPDLNWNNPKVIQEFDAILKFWLARDVDGFRIDVAQGLVKNMLMPDNPYRFPIHSDMSPRQVFAAFDHRYDLDQVGNLEIFRRWRKLVEPDDALLLGEVYLRDNDPNRVSRYVGSGDALHRAFYFAPMHVPWSPQPMWDTFRDALDVAPVDLSWALSSHDDPRAPTRFGGGEEGKQRALAYSTLLFFLPGLPFVYQGDELGLTSIELDPKDLADPVAIRNTVETDGRDGARSPIPWANAPEMGFTTGIPWIPLGGRSYEDTVEYQKETSSSSLANYRQLLMVRKQYLDPTSDLRWVASRGSEVIAFRRGQVICALNVGESGSEIMVPEGDWELMFQVGEIKKNSELLTFGANSAVVLLLAS